MAPPQNPPDLLVELRTRTRPQHEALEANVPLLSAQSTLAEYRAFLVAMYGYLAPIEPAVQSDACLNAAGFELPRRSKLPALRADLQALNVDPDTQPIAARERDSDR
jgi:heme oxygenase